VSGEQLVGGVGVGPALPDLGDPAVADVEHQRVVVLQRPASPLGADRVQATVCSSLATTSWTSTVKAPPVNSMVPPK
jgi:hypothetical protein